MTTENKKKVLLSGMQPTGMMHLGNYEGALANWVKLQNTGEYESYNCIVDWHSLTSIEETSQLKEKIYQMAADYIAGGLNPEKTAIFVQSHVKEHAELFLLFSMITPLPWLYRVPTYKEKAEALNIDNFGFLGYPVLQAADIMVYMADVVPVGKDQLPHLELTRELVRRFNYMFGPVFPEPKELMTELPLLLGTDGKKMSKSYNNDIKVGAKPDEKKKCIMSSYTDPLKIHKTDKGHPDGCPVFMYHSAYNAQESQKIKSLCESGDSDWGCVKCKKTLIDPLIEYFEPLRTERERLLSDRSVIDSILKNGGDRAREKASKTMKLVRQAMNMFPE